MNVLCSLMLTNASSRPTESATKPIGRWKPSVGHQDSGDQDQGEDLLAARAAGAGRLQSGVRVGVLVAQLAQQGEQHDGQRGEDEVQREAGSEEPALRDGEAVLQRDVVHQHTGDGQRREAAGVGSVDDEGAHEDRVDAGLVGQSEGRRGQQRHGCRGEGAQRRQRGSQEEEDPGRSMVLPRTRRTQVWTMMSMVPFRWAMLKK